MPLPEEIPSGVRVVVRTVEGRDPGDGRLKFRDYIGHVISWDGTSLDLNRDPTANGSRGGQEVRLPAASIIRIKPIPERSYPLGHRDGDRPSGRYTDDPARD